MKIVTWNCNGALRKKTKPLDDLDADIYVIQECEDPNLSTDQFKQWSADFLWTGKNKNKGLGIFSKKGLPLEKLNWHGIFEIKIQDVEHRPLIWNDDSLELFLPCVVNKAIPLLGVWTKEASSTNFKYMGQFWIYWQIHKQKLLSENQIICGDFNSNSIWDEPDRIWNHSDILIEMAQNNLHSIYHKVNCEDYGKESTPTFHLQKKLNKPYHIDYVFAQSKLIENCNLKILDPSIWLEFSDHVPIEFEFNI